MSQITNYLINISDSYHWTVTIPNYEKKVDPNSLYAFSSIDVQKRFSKKDLTCYYNTYNSLAIITGIPE